MAIDTAEKRFSIMNVGTPSTDTIIVADGTIAQGDRQHFLDLYSGILAGAPGGDETIAQARSIGRFIFSRISGRVN